MFGKELSEQTIQKACEMLKMDRDKIENSSVTTLRFEIEEMYENALSDILASAMNNGIVNAEIQFKKNVDELYSLLMNDIEDHLDVGGILI